MLSESEDSTDYPTNSLEIFISEKIKEKHIKEKREKKRNRKKTLIFNNSGTSCWIEFGSSTANQPKQIRNHA